MAVLVIEDEPHIRELIRLYLEREGYSVLEAGDGETGLAAAGCSPDLVILDIMLPRLDGWEVLRRLRRTGRVPVIMLTARSEESERVAGLELGADDYLTKPFSPRELVARVNAVLRRVAPAAASGREILVFPDFAIDATGREVTRAGTAVPFTIKEFDLLWLLASNPGRAFSREQLLEQVWDYAYAGDLRTVDVHVSRVRDKLGDTTSNPRYLKTVWGFGYKFEADKP